MTQSNLIKEFQLLFKKEDTDSEKVCHFLWDAENDAGESKTKFTRKEIYALIYTCLIEKPAILDEKVTQSFLSLLTNCDNEEENFINDKILIKLSNSREPLRSWSKFENLLVKMINCDAIKPEQIEAEVLQALKAEYPENTLNSFASCLKSVVDSFKRKDKYKDEQFVEILDWLAWFCSEEADL
ncbi:hypothetical protein HDE_08619 [Halotydeus destructor]|nr:hypothetical protein HDE_08619 [Halotydeus destructor]